MEAWWDDEQHLWDNIDLDHLTYLENFTERIPDFLSQLSEVGNVLYGDNPSRHEVEKQCRSELSGLKHELITALRQKRDNRRQEVKVEGDVTGELKVENEEEGTRGQGNEARPTNATKPDFIQISDSISSDDSDDDTDSDIRLYDAFLMSLKTDTNNCAENDADDDPDDDVIYKKQNPSAPRDLCGLIAGSKRFRSIVDSIRAFADHKIEQLKVDPTKLE
jgi:hypothetical protein